MLSRRNILLTGTAGAAAGLASVRWAHAADKVVKVGINLPFTGADAENADRIKDGAMLAFDEANAKDAIPGYRIEVVLYDDGTATAGQYDPAQAATNARKMVGDKALVAAVGPQMSGAGKAMAPILSEGDLAIITPTSTDPDITDPQFAAQFRPAGKAVYFRTVTTDAYQGPNMADFYAEVLKVPSLYVLDDSGAYSVGIADSFQKQAEMKGIKILGRDRLDPKAADYRAVLTKIKALNAPAIYYGGVFQAGVKVAKQGHEIIPKTIKRVAVFGKPVMRAAVRDAIQRLRREEPARRRAVRRQRRHQGRTISVFQVRKDAKYPLGDMLRQFAFVGVAPQS